MLMACAWHADGLPHQVFSKAIDGLGQLKLGTQGAIAAGPVGRDAALDGYFSQVMTSDDNDL